jgi:hypothetical protein
MMAGRYAHANQFRRHQRQLRIIRSRLGRIIREASRLRSGPFNGSPTPAASSESLAY